MAKCVRSFTTAFVLNTLKSWYIPSRSFLNYFLSLDFKRHKKYRFVRSPTKAQKLCYVCFLFRTVCHLIASLSFFEKNPPDSFHHVPQARLLYRADVPYKRPWMFNHLCYWCRFCLLVCVCVCLCVSVMRVSGAGGLYEGDKPPLNPTQAGQTCRGKTLLDVMSVPALHILSAFHPSTSQSSTDTHSWSFVFTPLYLCYPLKIVLRECCDSEIIPDSGTAVH